MCNKRHYGNFIAFHPLIHLSLHVINQELVNIHHHFPILKKKKKITEGESHCKNWSEDFQLNEIFSKRFFVCGLRDSYMPSSREHTTEIKVLVWDVRDHTLKFLQYKNQSDLDLKPIFRIKDNKNLHLGL